MIGTHLLSRLSSAADTAVNKVLKSGAATQISPPAHEVDFIAALVSDGITDIASAWKSILIGTGYSVQLTGVFTHKSPTATYNDAHGATHTCELSDLLVVVDDQTSTSPRRFAVLVQAKMAVAGVGKTLTSSGELVQHALMASWPKFRLSRPYVSGDRDFSTCSHPGNLADCGRYGLIDPQPNPRWEQHAPAVKMVAGADEFGTFLANMVMTGQTGFGREATGTGDDWSKTVDELLLKTLGAHFTHTAAFSTPQPRQRSQVAFWTNPNGMLMINVGAPGGPGGGDDDAGLEGPGISVIHAVVRYEDARR